MEMSPATAPPGLRRSLVDVVVYDAFHPSIENLTWDYGLLYVLPLLILVIHIGFLLKACRTASDPRWIVGMTLGIGLFSLGVNTILSLVRICHWNDIADSVKRAAARLPSFHATLWPVARGALVAVVAAIVAVASAWVSRFTGRRAKAPSGSRNPI
jgi:hypothetical protein